MDTWFADFLFYKIKPLGLVWDLFYLAVTYPVLLCRVMFPLEMVLVGSGGFGLLVKLRAFATASQALT